MNIGQPTSLVQGADTLSGTLDGYHRELGGVVYEIWVADDEVADA